MTPEYAVKPITTTDMLSAINRVKDKYSDQLDGEIKLATKLKVIWQTDGKTIAMEHIFSEIHNELSKLLNS